VLLLSLSLVLVLTSYLSNTTIVYGLVSNNINSNNIIIKPKILDPNPDLVDVNGKLKNDVSLVAKINSFRLGTIADGISKLLLVIDSNKTLQFSIDGTARDNLTKGALSSLDILSNEIRPSSNVIVDHQNISKNKSIVVAVYTPPDHINLQGKTNHTTINILVNGTSYPGLSFNLYRVPVVLVHGIWVNSNLTWGLTNFNKTLNENGFNYAFADYQKHNSETFDPYAIPKIGNYGIDSIRNKTHSLLEDYHKTRSIAAAQVDIVAHSMGGLMVRGFVQQPDYYNQTNFMKGYIHRLITIGTPHFGGNLSEILYSHRNDQYCFNPYTAKTFYRNLCLFNPLNFQLLPLKVIYAEKYRLPIDNGAVEALRPNSVAYSDLCQTNVSSYAIAGIWKPNAIVSHDAEEEFYKNILDNSFFELDRDGFHGVDNDLQVSMTSQLGGLKGTFRDIKNNILPNESAIYNSTVHGSLFIEKLDMPFVSSELSSELIQKDVVTLLNSPDNKFADAIGIGSLCHIPKSEVTR